MSNKNVFPKNLRSWANIMNENSAKLGKTRRAKRSASRNSGTPKSPRSGDTKGSGNNMMIYTTRPIILGTGETVRGHWTRAVDPEGDYGGPYADVLDLVRNPRYKSDMNNIQKNMNRASRKRRQ